MPVTTLNSSDSSTPPSKAMTMHSLRRALRTGWRRFLLSRPISVTYAMLFALIGAFVLYAIIRAQHAPMIIPLVGGFLYVGPILMSGFFALADRFEQRERGGFADVLQGFSRSSRDMLLLALLCTFLFVLWVLDTAILYAYLVGMQPQSWVSLLKPTEGVLAFVIISSVLGLMLAFVIFVCSAFAVPLLYYRRVRLLEAIRLSVLAVFSNIGPCLVWAALVSIALVASIVLFPLFLLSFPVLAFAGHALYRELFGPEPGAAVAAEGVNPSASVKDEYGEIARGS